MNGILNLHKPAGWTSHDVVARVRSLLGEKRIGHLGTLDPLATGVLPLVLGAATRLVEFAAFDKQYRAVCLLGRSTDSLDVTGRTLEERPAEGLDPERVRREVLRFSEMTQQVPPMVSALKRDGRKLYELAREGREVERPPRPVSIREVEVLGLELPRVSFQVTCSAGTYIRSLCQTLGEALGTGGCLESLERTRVGPFILETAATLGELKGRMEGGSLSELLIPPDILASHLPDLGLQEDRLHALCLGQKITGLSGPAGLFRVLNRWGRLCALAEVSEKGEAKPRKVFGPEGIH
jgi:tRNA pseudouridine55 synthase